MLISELGYGGAETAFLRLAGQLCLSADVTIALFRPSYGGHYTSTGGAAASAFPGTVVVLDEGSDGHPAAAGRIARWKRRCLRFAQLKRGHDVTISFLSGPNLLNALTPGGPSIISERGSKRSDIGVPPLKRWIWTRILDAMAYRQADAIVAASTGLASEIVQGHPRVASKTLAIEGTILGARLLAEADQDVEPEFTRFTDYRTLVACGRMHEQKGFDFLLRAFARVRAEHPDVRLLLIGDGPRQQDYLDLAAALGLRASTTVDPDAFDVCFAGYRAAPLRYYRLARAWALPSRYEGLPNSLIEALAAGVPVLAADCPWGARSILAEEHEVPSIPEVVTAPVDLRYGVLMPRVDAPGSELAWVTRIRDLLLGQAGRHSEPRRAQAVARFDIHNTAPRWLQLVYSLAASSQDGAIEALQND